MKIVQEYWDEELETIPPDQFKELRTLKMQKRIRYAYQNSLFYKNAFDEAGIRPEEIQTLEDFQERIPFLTHEQLIKNQHENMPFGNFLAVGIKDIRRIYCLPGPLIVPFSKSDLAESINITANALYICGARRGDIVDITVSYQWDMAGTMLDDGFRRLGCAVIPGGAGMTKTHLRVMNHLGVTVLFTFPSFALKLLETAREMGIDPRNDLKIRLMIITNEVCDENNRNLGSRRDDNRQVYFIRNCGYLGVNFSSQDCILFGINRV